MLDIFQGWREYTQETLAWDMDVPPVLFASQATKDIQNNATRLAEHGLRRKASWYILLGCDCEYLSLTLAKNLSLASNAANILIIENDLAKARAFLNAYAPLPQNIHLLADTSPWALYLLTMEQLSPQACPLHANSALIHWTMPPVSRPSCLNTWRKLFLSTQSIPIPQHANPTFKLSVGAIIHPHEAHLDEFFAHIPEWVHEIVVVWDSEKLPEIAKKFPCSGKAKHLARPLDNDFSAQRNTMLEHCSGQWMLYLDADERFTSTGWEQLAHIVNVESDFGVYFPRVTFEGDANHIRMSRGLWPDLQLRFFPLQQGIRFVGSVHETLDGLSGNFFLAPHLPLVHYSHIYKNTEQLRQRLATFNAAGSVEHKLSEAYPRLHKDFFDLWTKSKPCLLQLPK